MLDTGCASERRPGPPTTPSQSRVRPQFSEEAAENVISSLELELTMSESDEEPQVRPVDGRHVVPRIEKHSATDSACFIQGSGGSPEGTHVPWFCQFAWTHDSV